MRVFAIGDIHGQHNQLAQVLRKSGFDFEGDLLIILGDVVDKGRHSKECVEELLKVRSKVFVEGNHDHHFKRWLNGNHRKLAWRIIGGRQTMKSYGTRASVPLEHEQFFQSSLPYYIYENCLFVHGGIDPRRKLEEHDEKYFRHDRKLIAYARKRPIPGFEHVFIGHTSTQFAKFGTTKPLTFHNLTMLDTGASLPGGKITIMDIKTREYWQA